MRSITVHIDNAAVVEGFEKGKEWCCAVRRPHADVWRQIWRAVDGVGLENVAVVKCKSHVTKKVRAGFDGAQEHIQAGNDRADEYAKLGAEADDGDRFVKQAVDEAADRVKGVLSYVAEFAEQAFQEGGGWAEGADGSPAPGICPATWERGVPPLGPGGWWH